MNDHNIELNKLYTDVKQYLKSFVKNKENKRLILEGLGRIYDEETRKNPIPLESKKNRVIVNSREEYYPFLLSVYLLINDVKKLYEILEFQRSNFRSNRLIEDAEFDLFLNSYVWESIKIIRVQLNISNYDFEEFENYWKEYFSRIEGFSSKPIHFIMDEDFKKSLIDKISQFVLKDDHFLLVNFFSENKIKFRVRFTVPANSVADLFFRLHKHNKLEKWCSKSNTARWLADRIMTKGERQKFYIKPKSEPLKNILLEKKKTAIKILLDVLPLIWVPVLGPKKIP